MENNEISLKAKKLLKELKKLEKSHNEGWSDVAFTDEEIVQELKKFLEELAKIK